MIICMQFRQNLRCRVLWLGRSVMECPHYNMTHDYVAYAQGRGTPLKLRGGGQTSPGVQGHPNPKLPGFGLLFFWGENQVHVQKQTKIKMNDIDPVYMCNYKIRLERNISKSKKCASFDSCKRVTMAQNFRSRLSKYFDSAVGNIRWGRQLRKIRKDSCLV